MKHVTYLLLIAALLQPVEGVRNIAAVVLVLQLLLSVTALIGVLAYGIDPSGKATEALRRMGAALTESRWLRQVKRVVLLGILAYQGAWVLLAVTLASIGCISVARFAVQRELIERGVK